jgi:hypothetical protein
MNTVNQSKERKYTPPVLDEKFDSKKYKFVPTASGPLLTRDGRQPHYLNLFDPELQPLIAWGLEMTIRLRLRDGRITDKTAAMYSYMIGQEKVDICQKQIDHIMGQTFGNKTLNNFIKYFEKYLPSDSPLFVQLSNIATTVFKTATFNYDRDEITRIVNMKYDREVKRWERGYAFSFYSKKYRDPVFGYAWLDNNKSESGVSIWQSDTDPAIITKWKNMFNPWIDGLTNDIRKDLSQCTYWYSLTYDTYLNTRARNRPFSKSRAMSNLLNFDFQSNYQSYGFELEYDINNPECTCTYVKQSPSEKFRWTNLIKDTTTEIDFDAIFADYIKTVEESTDYMHRVLTQHTFELTEEMFVYRSVFTKKGMFGLDLKGFTSTTTHFDSTVVLNDTIMKNNGIYDYDNHDYIIMKITLPVGTKVIPIQLCGLFNEHEILIISQGKLEITEQKTDEFIHNEMPVQLYNCTFKVDTTNELPILHPFVLTDDYMIYGGRRKHDHKTRRSKKSHHSSKKNRK